MIIVVRTLSSKTLYPVHLFAIRDRMQNKLRLGWGWLEYKINDTTLISHISCCTNLTRQGNLHLTFSVLIVSCCYLWCWVSTIFIQIFFFTSSEIRRNTKNFVSRILENGIQLLNTHYLHPQILSHLPQLPHNLSPSQPYLHALHWILPLPCLHQRTWKKTQTLLKLWL